MRRPAPSAALPVPPSPLLSLLLALLLLPASAKFGLAGPISADFARDQPALGAVWAALVTGAAPCNASTPEENFECSFGRDFFVSLRPQHALDATGMDIPGFDCRERAVLGPPTPVVFNGGFYSTPSRTSTPSPSPGIPGPPVLPLEVPRQTFLPSLTRWLTAAAAKRSL